MDETCAIEPTMLSLVADAMRYRSSVTDGIKTKPQTFSEEILVLASHKQHPCDGRYVSRPSRIRRVIFV